MRVLPTAIRAQLILTAFAPTDNSSSITTDDDAILLDAPAFADPTNAGSTLSLFEAFVFHRDIDVNPTVAILKGILALFGVTGGDSSKNLVDRSKLFAAKGLGDATIVLDVGGCSLPAVLDSTDGSSHTGIINRNVSLGSCQPITVSKAQVVLPPSDPRIMSSNVFFYPDGGFGVISDVDDTIKITNVLHTSSMLKSTFIDDPAPVAGMPELYASIAKNFSPHFLYVSGSMLQLYPFLRSFINQTYATANGPLFLRNLTSISDVVNFMQSNGVFDYKLTVIDQIKGMYPHKKFLAIGDSTQKDPETYGEAYRKYGDFITCAWIRRVEDADNSDARFAAAFQGMPSIKWRVFQDSDIPGLANINIAAGEC